MSQNNMELMVWGSDGKPRLTFWDNEHGDDKVFVLNEDGTTTLETYEGNEDIEVFQAGFVNLVEELRKMAFAWDAKRQEIFNHIRETRQAAEQCA